MSKQVDWEVALDAIEPKEATFWEKAVGYTFNPSGDSKVYQVKRLFASLIDLIYDAQSTEKPSYLANTLYWMALRSCITAQMAVVKFLTWKD